MKGILRLMVAMGVALAAAPAATPQAGGTTDAEGFPLPAEAVARIGSARLRHAGVVRAVAYSADGKAIISLAEDNTLRLWDAATGKLLRTTATALDLHALQAFRSDGKTVDVLSHGVLQSFDPFAGKELRKALITGVPNPHRACFTPNGKLLALGFTGQDLVSLRDGRTAQEVSTLKLTRADLSGLAITPDAKLVIAVSPVHNEVEFLDVSTRRLAGRVTTPADKARGQPSGALVSPDGARLLVTGCNWAPDTVWDVATRKLVCSLDNPGHGLYPEAFAFSPDGRHVAVSSHLGVVTLHDAATGKLLHRLATGPCTALAFSRDGKRLLAGNADGGLSQWDVASGARQTSADPLGSFRVRRFLGPRQLLVETDRLEVYDPTTGRPVRALPWAGTWFDRTRLAVSADGRRLAIPNADNAIDVLDADSGKPVRTLTGHRGMPARLAWAPDGQRLYATCTDLTLRAWDAASGTLLHTIEGRVAPRGPVSGSAFPHEQVAVSPDGRWVATAAPLPAKSGGFFVRVFDADTGKPVYQRESPQRLSEHLAFAPTGELFFTRDGTAAGPRDVLVLVNPADGRTQWELALDKARTASVAFAPDGHALAVGGDDGSLVLYETATGQVRHAFRGHRRPVDGVAFTPAGDRLAASSADAPTFVWDVYGRGRRAGAAPWTAEDARSAWAGLADRDAPAGFAVVCRLVANPEAAVAVLREHLRPAERIPKERVRELLRDLDSEDFETRRRATAELDRHAGTIEAQLRAATTVPLSLEVQRRLAAVLAKLDPADPERLRQARAVEALGQMATPAAVVLLEALARGEPGARLTQDAARAVERRRRR